MDELPWFAVPTVFSFMDTIQTSKCACVSKRWELSARDRIAEIRKQATEKREKVCVAFLSKNEPAYWILNQPDINIGIDAL